jgi:hypothetical protein
VLRSHMRAVRGPAHQRIAANSFQRSRIVNSIVGRTGIRGEMGKRPPTLAAARVKTKPLESPADRKNRAAGRSCLSCSGINTNTPASSWSSLCESDSGASFLRDHRFPRISEPSRMWR